MAPLMRLEGKNHDLRKNSAIELYEDRLTFKYPGYTPYEIPIKTIVRIRSTPPGLLTWGSLKFTVKDDKGNTNDYNCIVLFNSKGAADAEKLRLKLEEMIKAIPPVARSPEPAPMCTQASSDIAEIEKLAGLKARGIITEDEFQAKKQHLLFGSGGGPVLHEKEIIREIVRVPCPYCGALMDITNVKCPSCGAPVGRR